MTDPVFSKFPKESVRFLKDLKTNNNRDWFHANKTMYDRAIKSPAKAFGAAMAADLETLTGIPHAAKIFRINRDLRFSKDKTPYNTHLHMSFLPEIDLPSPPCWFFALETERIGFGSGVFGFERPALESFRERIVGKDGAKLGKLIQDLEADGLRLGEPHLKRVPAGYPADHPQAHLLKHKGLSAWTEIKTPGIAAKAGFMKTCGTTFTRLKPLFDWLAAA